MSNQQPHSSLTPDSLCLASSLVLSEKPLPVSFFYRETPQHQNDTGFRFYSGLESDEFLMSEDAALVAPLDCIIRLDESLKDLIDCSEIGCVWEKNSDGSGWVPVTDYQIPD